MTVHLVAAGPGDPGLWTVRAERLLATAAVVVCDRELIEAVGPLTGADTMVVAVDREDDAATAVVAHGRAGTGVVRLAAGDRLVLEAGGVEAAALRAAGIDHAVMPAVLACFATPAAGGIPVMARPCTATLTVAVGHEPPPVSTGTVVTLASPSDARPVVTGAVTGLNLTDPPAT